MTQTPNNPLAYTGIDEGEQPRFLSTDRSPTTNDKFSPGTQWEDSLTNTIYITTVKGVWVSISSGEHQINPISGTAGLTWNDAAVTTTMTSNNGYIVTTGAQVFTLPKASSVGDTIEILLNGGTSWKIAQVAGQSVIVNASTTTVGVGGSVTTTGAGQSIKLTCVTANTKWQTTSLIGNPKIA